MKKLFNYICMFTATSCGDEWLNLEPSTSIETATSINTLANVEATLNGIYSDMQSSDAYSGRLVYYGDVTGDDMQSTMTGKRTSKYYAFDFHEDNGPSTHWSCLYSFIQNCNMILNNIDKIEIFESEEEYRNDLKGQALAIRGMALFDLTRIFGYPYMKDNGASLGVPIVTTSNINDKPKRNTVAECYTQIINDLTSATSLLSGSFNKGKFNKWAAMTLLSRVYLYKGDNNNALTMAEEAIEGAENKKWKLWLHDDYPYAWANDATKIAPGEVLFEIVNLTTDGPGKESMGYLSSGDGYQDMCITTSFYDLLSQDPNDIRLQVLSNYENDYFYANKYQPQKGETIEDANIPLIRLAETYLNAAEAAVKLGNNETAVKYLDPIVRRANPNNTVEGMTLTLEDVLNERRKELFAEGHRMFDVIRNGLMVKRFDVPNEQMDGTEHYSNHMEYDWNFYRIILPIPKAEMDTNPNMVQNPEY